MKVQVIEKKGRINRTTGEEIKGNLRVCAYARVSTEKEEQYKSMINMKKKVFPLIILLNYVFAVVYLVIQHGSLPIDKCFPYIIFYTFGVFGLYQYESYKTLCITQGKPTILLIGSTIGSCIRVIICYLFYNTSIALLIFGIVNFIDFYIRSLIYRTELSKIKISQ